MPLYFTVLTVTMGLYFVELIQNWPIGYILLLLIGFIAWMIYSYFVWGKRIMQKEENRLTDIIDTLKQKTEQLKVN